MKKSFVTYLLLFFIPLLLAYAVMEYLTMNIPAAYEKNAFYLAEKSDTLEVLVLGSSQMMHGINSALLDTPTINLASGNQHHDTDFKILKKMNARLPNLKTVVIEVSYSHFELPHNGKDFWKNNFYLNYYNVNAFERNTYFKDKLLFASNPPIISKRIYEHYYEKSKIASYNTFGFDTLNYGGRFQTYNYDASKFADKRFKINTVPNRVIFQKNTTLFYEMLDFLKENNKHVIICTAPMFSSYLDTRVPEIQNRRDTILKEIESNYSNVTLFLQEENITDFGIRDYWNESHLNPDGAKTFSRLLQATLDSIN